MNNDMLDIFFIVFITVFILALLMKIMAFLFKNIFVPSVKIVWKLLVIFIVFSCVFAFFVVLYFSREFIFDALDTPIQYSILAFLALIASIKYLKNK